MDESTAALSGLIRDIPDFPVEGILFKDITTLLREPQHFAALAGQATILMRQGRMELGQKALRRAVEIHPWLKERSMLIPLPGEIPPGPGKDI